ncbi:hypothetical protein QE410_002718 [Microbacterium sp. SORGH_AS 1204]|uniref:hypothetical protein n=1 Tax=Microbacterium sp. SORGH_AS_1204 TaxID=3041785 RepID=UPI002792E4E1|nr:hypothetical protein [Microbacterium sp. SORGH_AS_1204]MDQ1137919.1 hypothetical protein [Microbacterium sp. SORGH_AS_1204]
MTRVGSRLVVLAAGGVIGATVLATPALALTVDSREGDATATTSTTYAEPTLTSGQRPGPFFGPPDRTRGNSYGTWTDDTEARARWVLESPRGPWDTLRIVDRLGAGQRFDCQAGVRVRATADVDPRTGYLVDPVELPADRVEIVCSRTTLSVTVVPVGDEIVEVSVASFVDKPHEVATSRVEFVGTRVEPDPTPTPPVVTPTPPVVTPTPPVVTPTPPVVTPTPPVVTPTPPVVTPTPPVVTPTPPVVTPTPPAGDPTPPAVVRPGRSEGSPVAAPGPKVQESPAAAAPARLAATGVDASWLPLLFAGALGAVGSAMSLLYRRRHRSRA